MTFKHLAFKQKGAGLPVVLLHCSLANKSQWEQTIAVLSAEFNTISLDLLGYGQNPAQELVNNFCLDWEVEAIMDTLQPILSKNEAFHIIAHSYGAAVAFKLAQKYPSRILSLTAYEPVSFHLLEPEHPEIRNIKRFYSMCKQLVSTKKNTLAAEMFIDFWNGKGAFKAFSEKNQKAFSRRIEKVLLDFQAIVKDPMTISDLTRLPFLTHLIAGTATRPAATAVIEQLHKHLIYSTLDYIEAGHLGPMTHAAMFNQLVYRFYMSEQKALSS